MQHHSQHLALVSNDNTYVVTYSLAKFPVVFMHAQN